MFNTFAGIQTESLLINDIRQSARTRTKELTLQRWLIKGNWSGFFACKGIIELGQSVLRTGSAFHQSALIHLATNSVHFYWSDTDGRESELLQLQCDDCSYVIASEVPLTIDHLAICPSASAIQTRATICRVVLQHLNSFPNCVTWLRAHGRSSLSEVMSSLFPLSVTATPEEVILYLPRCMIGGFTVGESTQASKMLRFLSQGQISLQWLTFCPCGNWYSGLRRCVCTLMPRVRTPPKTESFRPVTIGFECCRPSLRAIELSNAGRLRTSTDLDGGECHRGK